MENIFRKNPVKIAIFDPIKGRIKHTFVVCGKVPREIKDAIAEMDAAKLKSFYGAEWKQKLAAIKNVVGGEETEEDPFNFDTKDLEIDIGEKYDNIADLIETNEKLQKKMAQLTNINEKYAVRPSFADDGDVSYEFDISIFPEDKAADILAKIYLLSGIPTYRQHLFWQNGDFVLTNYKLNTESSYNVNITELNDNAATSIGNVPIDMQLYNLRHSIKIFALNEFMIAKNMSNIFYVVDIDQFMNAQISSLLTDKYQFSVFYYGFVIKYFPIMTEEMFIDYLTNESSIAEKYPAVALPQRQIFKDEAAILNDKYAAADSLVAFKNTKDIRFGISSMLCSTSAFINNPINIRTLFDKMRLADNIVQITAHVTYENQRYLFKKTIDGAERDISVPKDMNKKGMTIVISRHANLSQKKISLANELSAYIYLNILNTGKYFIRLGWDDDLYIDFDAAYADINKYVNPILTKIDSLSKYVFTNQIGTIHITRTNIKYISLNIGISWMKVINEKYFNFIKNFVKAYENANIFKYKFSPVANVLEFTYKKGIYDYDLTLIDRVLTAANLDKLRNQYAASTISSVRQKWLQIFGGRNFKISHRSVDVKFEISGIKESEFPFFESTILFLIHSLSKDNTFKIGEIATGEKIKRLKKLQEIDPELYNPKRIGSKKVYSILCQKARQPLVFTESEAKEMQPRDLAKLVKYWNFTSGREIYYKCPSAKYPHLSFITGMHPKNYCLPCCGKLSSIESSKKSKVNKVCLAEHVFEETAADGKPHKHIVNFNKELDVGRLAHLPKSPVRSLFEMTSPPENNSYFVFGTKQHLENINNVGIIYIAARALERGISDINTEMIEFLRKNPHLFELMVGGDLKKYFGDLKTLASTLALNSGEFQKYDKWNMFYMEYFYLAFNIHVVWADFEHGTASFNMTTATKNELLKTSAAKYLFAIKLKNKYYPIVVANPTEYFKTFKIGQMLFSREDDIVNLVASMQKNDISDKITYFNLQKYKIAAKYINLKNEIYAVLLEDHGGEIIYVPIIKTQNINDDVKTIREPYSPQKISPQFLGRFFAAENIAAGDLLYFGDILIGVMASGEIYYLSDPGEFTSRPIKKLTFSPIELNRSIYARESPADDEMIKNSGKHTYEMRIYDFVLAEFINFVQREKNAATRKKIEDIIAAPDFYKNIQIKQHAIKKLMNAKDYEIIEQSIYEYYYNHFDKKTLIRDIFAKQYEFDQKIYQSLIGMPPDELRQKLGEIIDKFCVVGEANIAKFPNVYVPCEYEETGGICRNKKLLIKDREKMISLLANDISNPLKNTILLVSHDNIINYFNFEKNPGEIISITKE